MSPRPLPAHLQARLSELPDRPGVYLFKDRQGQAVYIGKALSIKKRVGGHFRFYGAAASKESVMLSHVARVDFLETPSEAEALLLEASLVKEQLPKYNKMLRDDKSYPYLKVTDEEWPRLLVARVRKADGAGYFGPYTDVGSLRQAVKMLRREFPLRTCRKMPKKVCLQYHLGLCGGPCEGHQTKEAYAAAVRELTRFLEGRRDALVRNLSKRMREYAGSHDFEKAQAMRDAIGALASMPVPARSAGSALDTLGELQRVFSLPSPPRRIECFDISNIQGHQPVGSMVVFEDGEPARREYRHFRIREVAGIDDYRMMREVVRRRYGGTLSRESRPPDLILIDGGKGHLAAAKKELDALGLQTAVLSIAKQHEHIFEPGREAPYVLTPFSRALQMVRHLRDEAHRFAIQHYRKLHRRSMLGGSTGSPRGRGKTMKRAKALAFAALFMATAAQADMVEVKGKGILNGEVLSQDDKQMQFKDAKGKTHVFAKKDVLFVELDKNDTGSSTSVSTWKNKASRALASAKSGAKKVGRSVSQTTKKVTGAISQPLDDGAGAPHAGPGGMNAGPPSEAEVTKARESYEQQLKRQQQLGQQGEDVVKSQAGYVDNYDASKGRFGKLDD